MERVGRLLCLALVLSLPFVLGAVLVLLVLHLSGGLPATGSRHTMVHGRDRDTPNTHGTRASSGRNRPLVTTAIAAAPAGTAAPAVLGVTATPPQLGLLDTVTIATTLYNGGPIAGPYVATLQLLSGDHGIGPSAAQGGFMLRHGQRLTLYWEWRAGASLPPGVYTVRVVLRDAARPGRLVASGTAITPLSVRHR
jgi:hypothetical protein